MYEELFNEIGLTKNESLVYLALLKIGKSKTGKIVKEAKISGGKIYETLYKLVNKGLVKLVEENGIKNFIANDPETILDYIKEKELVLKKKEREVEKMLPELKELKKIDKNLETVSLVKGFRGVSAIVYNALKKGELIQVMGVRSSKDEKFNAFWKKWHFERIRMRKNSKMLFSDKNTDYWRLFKKMKFTEVRQILQFVPSAIMTIDNETFIFSYEEELGCIHIISDKISKSFVEFFNSLWKIAEK